MVSIRRIQRQGRLEENATRGKKINWDRNTVVEIKSKELGYQ